MEPLLVYEAFAGSVLNWLDQHSGALVAIGTVALVAITAIYVRITYLLVRAQRLQARNPVLVFDFQSAGSNRFDLLVRNTGAANAEDVTLLLGPGDVPSAFTVPERGLGYVIGPHESRTWGIGSSDGAGFQIGDRLPLTMSWFDEGRARVWVHSFGVRIESWGASGGAGVEIFYTKRDLKRLVRLALRWDAWLRWRWRVRRDLLNELFDDEAVRSCVRDAIVDELESAGTWATARSAGRF
jgi:hypothetical protein